MSKHFQIGNHPLFDAAMLEHQGVAFTASPAYPQLRVRLYQMIEEISRGRDVRQEVHRTQADVEWILGQYQEGNERSVPLAGVDAGVSRTAVR